MRKELRAPLLLPYAHPMPATDRPAAVHYSVVRSFGGRIVLTADGTSLEPGDPRVPAAIRATHADPSGLLAATGDRSLQDAYRDAYAL